jgi:hypothetical protein
MVTGGIESTNMTCSAGSGPRKARGPTLSGHMNQKVLCPVKPFYALLYLNGVRGLA